MNPVNSLMEQLHDIEGLDPVSWWPLAMGWWVLIGAGILIFFAAGWYAARKLAFRRSWKYDTIRKLTELEDRLSDVSASEAAVWETAVLFSEYLRRIAMRRHARSQCAGLVGEAWLEWLSRHDVKNFDWKTKGKLLIEVPYAPVDRGLAADEIKIIIQAAKEWVR